MYKWEGLNNININLIKNIYVSDEYRWKSNLVSIFNSNNLLKKILLWKNIKFLKIKNEYVGFIWFNKLDKNKYKINSIKVMADYNTIEYYKMLLSAVKKNSIIIYYCKSSDIEYYIFTKLGFDKKRTIVEMKKPLNSVCNIDNNSQVSFYKFEKNKDEKLRCFIQNGAFSDLSRCPINEADIYFEQSQKYYLDDGCIFIEFQQKVVGYGQIIVDNEKAYIVNFGILEEYRGKGLGKLLLKYLLNLCYSLKYNEIYLKCNENNISALELYKSMGFIQYDVTYEMYKIS